MQAKDESKAKGDELFSADWQAVDGVGIGIGIA